jgi:hypothetical protein
MSLGIGAMSLEIGSISLELGWTLRVALGDAAGTAIR